MFRKDDLFFSVMIGMIISIGLLSLGVVAKGLIENGYGWLVLGFVVTWPGIAYGLYRLSE